MTDDIPPADHWAPTVPLWVEPCGCPPDEGHRCRPPFADEEGWPEPPISQQQRCAQLSQESPELQVGWEKKAAGSDGVSPPSLDSRPNHPDVTRSG